MHTANLVAIATAFTGLIALIALSNDNMLAFSIFLVLFALGTFIIHILFQVDKSKQSFNKQQSKQ